MFLRVLWNCYQVSRNQWLEPSRLRKLQEKRLSALVTHAYHNVPLYRKKFDAAGVRPEDIQTLEDLPKLPLTTKAEVHAGIPARSLARGYTDKEFIRTSTSGTSGGPLQIFYDKRCYDMYLAGRMYRNITAMGFHVTDKQVLLNYHRPDSDAEEGARMSKVRRSRGQEALGLTLGVFKRWRKRVYIAYSGDEVLHDITVYQPKIIKANPSYLRLVAEQIQDQEITSIHPHALITNGEVLDEPTRTYLESVFQCPVFDWYGAHESHNAAWECRNRVGRHVNADIQLLEIVRDGEPVDPGEQGEIVSTHLLSYGMPFIRYRLGDIGVLDDHLCSCGRTLPLLKSVEGRLVDAFRQPDGSSVTPKAVMTVIQGTPGVSRYQAVQEREDRVRVELMARPRDPPVAVDELVERCHALLGDDVDIQVAVTDRTRLKAKFRPVISKLTVAAEPRWTEPRALVT